MGEVEQIVEPSLSSDSSPLSSLPARDRDIQEVLNYRLVMDFIDEVARRSHDAGEVVLTEAQLKEIHRLTVDKLLSSVEAGSYRSVKVVIRNTTTGEITFRPPNPLDVPSLMTEFFAWLNSPEGQSTHPLLRAGILHYELVRIHPFTDGNGRSTRALSLLLLFLAGYEIKRFFSLDEYYDRDPQSYYDSLQTVSITGDMTSWLEYFILGISIEFSRVKTLVQKLSLDLHLKSTLGGTQIALSDRQIKLVEYLEKYVSLGMSDAKNILLNVSEDTILRDLRDLVDKKLITRRGNTKGAKYYLNNNSTQQSNNLTS